MGKTMFDIIGHVDKYRDLILEAEEYIWKNPETGYVEYKTSRFMAEKFKSLGYELQMAGNIPGFFTVLDTGQPGPTLLMFAELDSLVVETHPDADKTTNAVHACGHHTQCAALLGVAAVLRDMQAEGLLSGKIKLCVVPAEEGVVVEQIEEFRRKGVIRYVSGKQEFMYRGFFDDCDLAFMMHSRISKEDENVRFALTKGSNGVIRKVVRFEGKAAHAGSDPEKGINALYAANLFLNAVNALRETFKDEDHMRVHPIISKGGLAVNSIPDDVVVESFVRGADIDSVMELNRKVNRAAAGAAIAIGAKVSVRDRLGSEPLRDNTDTQKAAIEAVEELFGSGSAKDTGEWLGSSTDMGDISAIMPAMHGYIDGGVAGNLHGSDFRVVDSERASVDSAIMQIAIILKLMGDGAKVARRIVENGKGKYRKIPEVLDIFDKINIDRELVEYGKDGVSINC